MTEPLRTKWPKNALDDVDHVAVDRVIYGGWGNQPRPYLRPWERYVAVVRLARLGMPANEIARHIDLDPRHVHRYLKKAGLR